MRRDKEIEGFVEPSWQSSKRKKAETWRMGLKMKVIITESITVGNASKEFGSFILIRNHQLRIFILTRSSVVKI